MPEAANPVQQAQTIIEIRPFRGGWQCFEGPGVQPYWTGKDAKQSAIKYATARAKFGRGQIRVLNADGSTRRDSASSYTSCTCCTRCSAPFAFVGGTDWQSVKVQKTGRAGKYRHRATKRECSTRVRVHAMRRRIFPARYGENGRIRIPVPTPALSKIIYSPERLKIRVMTRNTLLFCIHQIEGGKGSNVIDVPEFTILPRHSG